MDIVFTLMISYYFGALYYVNKSNLCNLSKISLIIFTFFFSYRETASELAGSLPRWASWLPILYLISATRRKKWKDLFKRSSYTSDPIPSCICQKLCMSPYKWCNQDIMRLMFINYSVKLFHSFEIMLYICHRSHKSHKTHYFFYYILGIWRYIEFIFSKYIYYCYCA